MLLQTQDQNEKLYNVLRGSVQEMYYRWGLFSLFGDFKVKLGGAGDHRSIAS